MCGRYVAVRKAEELAATFGVADEHVAAAARELGGDYNVAPTKVVPAVLERLPRRAGGSGGGSGGASGGGSGGDSGGDSDGGSGGGSGGSSDRGSRGGTDVGSGGGTDLGSDGAPVRRLEVVRWGLVPSWAQDPAIGSRLINARVETVADKPAFRRAFAARRCLLPADGYYEWQPATRSDGTAYKQPWLIRSRDGGLLALAGLYEFWRDRNREADDPQAWLVTATVLTTTAEDDLGRIHDRMPMLVEPDRWDAWLDPRAADAAALRALLVPATPGRLEAVAVPTLVNDVRRNGPELVAPLPLAP